MIALERYAITSSFAVAAFRSVSSVMYVFLIHSAVEERVQRRFKSSFALATKAFASSGVGFPDWARPAPETKSASEREIASQEVVFMARHLRQFGCVG